MTTDTFGRALPAGWTTVDSDVALEIASHEAVIRQAYKDSQGVWTWSVGITNASGHNVERYIGKPQPLEHCLAVYAWALQKYAKEVLEAFKGHPLTKAQFTAALSFHWNTGDIKTATWVRRWKEGDIQGARAAFLWYNKPASIITRRTKECELFFDGKWSNNGIVVEYTRLTAKSTPDWSSARRIDITKEMKAVLGEDIPSAPDGPELVADAPIPPPPDIEPTPAPIPQPASSGGFFYASLKNVLEALFGRKA